ncbi:sensor histidine kinase [Nocardioides bizhenqiangii]|uniref:histidine kinase n=1 Tax=Nocardioides bizhenqiangii TaxID=3095076 RepID=A0ABZ0ZVB4_9ACTN|nr:MULTISPECIES: HAMP domain-containing sensor histidine kinase [unclassified Nocardioides]MDZ5621727.1 HAMP domain-containing sensor histidine kinase [Nocardioides sp. HM23]WQQ27587.1 HAMP domain-containing sensor histidine kinase [Nocardioides sp. HM61]
MRRRIGWLVAATTSAVILGFVIPLCLLVQTLAHERAVSTARDDADDVALIVSGLHGDPGLPDVVRTATASTFAATSVVTPRGTVMGDGDADLPTDPDVERAREGAAFTTSDDDGVTILSPVVTADGTYVVHAQVSDEQLSAGVTRAWFALGLLGLLLIIAALVIADRFARRISTPVTALADVALQLRDGELDVRAVPSGPPETVELADALNQLADRISELLVAERAAVGDLSHRLRTPVTALRLDAEAVADPGVAQRLQEHVAHLQRTVDAIVRDARRPVRHTIRAGCDARTVVADRMAFWSALAEDQGRPVRVRLTDGPAPVAVDAADLTDVLDVLVDNVFAHTPEDAAIDVTLEAPGGQVLMEISDTGPGIGSPGDAGERPGSTGLGLQIARRTVAAIGGTMDIRSGAGTTVTLTLPAAQHATA